MITYKEVKIGEPFQSGGNTLMAYIPQGMNLKLYISIDGNFYDEVPKEMYIIGDLTDETEKVLKINNLMCNSYLKFVGTGTGKIKLKI